MKSLFHFRIFYAAVDGDVQYLGVADPDGGNERRLVEFDGFVYFVASPDGSRVAFQAIGGQSPGGGVQAAAPGVLASATLAQPATTGLSVLDVGTGDITNVSANPEIAFFWSPQGDRLLSLGVATGADLGRLRWQVWEDGGSFTTDPFVPSVTMQRDYFPFFDQYAKSMTLWAPDGSAFAYAGTGPGGSAGIWVQSVEEGVDPVRVADGSFVAWSPN